jgi:hypothetical protein
VCWCLAAGDAEEVPPPQAVIVMSGSTIAVRQDNILFTGFLIWLFPP